MSDTVNSAVDSHPKSIDLLEPADYGQYLLHNRSEILFVLRQLLERGSQINVFFNEGADLLLTTLMSVSDAGLVFDYGANIDTNQRAVQSSKLFCVALLDKVRVQFILPGLRLVTPQGRPAFSAVLPDTLLRLQRREYFRLTMPLSRRVTCQIPVPTGQQIEVEVVDLSGGGLAMVLAPGNAHIEPDMEFPNCHIELPEVGSVTATVRVLTIFEVTLRNGSHVKRAGCCFVNLPGTMINLIQRYIIRIERERKARETGLQ